MRRLLLFLIAYCYGKINNLTLETKFAGKESTVCSQGFGEMTGIGSWTYREKASKATETLRRMQSLVTIHAKVRARSI